MPVLVAAIGLLLLILLAGGAYLLLGDKGDGQGATEARIVVTEVIMPQEAITVVVTSQEAVTVTVPPAAIQTSLPPTDTPAPQPADDSQPSSMSLPTLTPLPTYTPLPTQIPLPTYTPPQPAATQAPPTAAPTVPPATPTQVPVQQPPPTVAPQATCPGWYSKPQPGMGILVIENHIGEELQVEQIQGGTGQWRIAAKQGDTPGRLLLQLPPGNQEFVLYLDRGGQGHIQLSMEAGQQSVSPVWISGSPDEPVYPLTVPPGCG